MTFMIFCCSNTMTCLQVLKTEHRKVHFSVQTMLGKNGYQIEFYKDKIGKPFH